ncbi:MAG: hypothetical protein HY220_01260, partial [Candidatus Sungbacteria bacterium]|nr:hypothetical protein [Candidatus Sungbacteria bacterium]
QVFGQAAFAEHYKPRIDAEQHLGGFVASHEMAHAIGLAPDIKERLGKDFVSPYVEEWKATAGGLVFNNWLPYKHKQRKASLKNLRTELVHQLANSSRYSAIRDKDSMKAYYRQSIMLMKVAEETGVVQRAGKGKSSWKINLDKAAVLGFFERVAAQYHELLRIYAEGSRSELEGFVSKNLQTTEFVDYMARAVENKKSKTPLPAPVEATRLPTAAP